MAYLSCYLPPFAGDYSGACSLLFETDCLVLIIDAGCCTRNYTEYDEPRWRHRRRGTFTAQLRTLDVALGDEEGIIAQVIEAAELLDPPCIALVGTPVPALVGMDMEGMAYEIEARTSIPTIGIPTAGFNTYEQGISTALTLLFKHFLPKTVRGKTHPHEQIAILGATPLDFPNYEEVDSFAGAVRTELCFQHPFDLMVERASEPSYNLVVSWGGFSAAKYAYRQKGIAFAVGCPLGPITRDRLQECLDKNEKGLLWESEKTQEQIKQKHPNPANSLDVSPVELHMRKHLYPVGAAVNASIGSEEPGCEEHQVLLIGDQVIMNSLRAEIYACCKKEGIKTRIAVASFFSMEEAWMEKGDISLSGEADLDAFAHACPQALIVGDPLLEGIPGVKRDSLLTLVHPAISSDLFCAASHTALSPSIDGASSLQDSEDPKIDCRTYEQCIRQVVDRLKLNSKIV